MDVKIDKDLIDEMSQCIYDCSWVSADEISAYIKATLTDSDYEPEDWSVDGRGMIEKDRAIEHDDKRGE